MQLFTTRYYKIAALSIGFSTAAFAGADAQTQQAFLQAAQNRDLKELTRLLDLSDKNNWNLALAVGSVEQREVFGGGSTPGNALHQAIVGKIPGPKRLLSFDDDSSSSSKNKSNSDSLIEAPLAEVVRLLIQRGCNVNEVNHLGKTPLHYALNDIFNTMDPLVRLELTRILMESGANPLVFDKSGNSPLDELRTPKMRDIYARLFEIYNPNFLNDLSVRQKISRANSSLRDGVMGNNALQVRDALALGANPNLSIDSDGTRMPLIVFATVQDNPTIIESLVKAGAEVDKRFKDKDGTRGTALAMAMILDHRAAAKALLDLGADPNLKIKNKETFKSIPVIRVWQFAAVTGNLEIVQDLIARRVRLKMSAGEFRVKQLLQPKKYSQVGAIYEKFKLNSEQKRKEMKERDAEAYETAMIMIAIFSAYEKGMRAVESGQVEALEKELKTAEEQLLKSGYDPSKIETQRELLSTGDSAALRVVSRLMLAAIGLEQHFNELLEGGNSNHIKILQELDRYKNEAK